MKQKPRSYIVWYISIARWHAIFTFYRLYFTIAINELNFTLNIGKLYSIYRNVHHHTIPFRTIIITLQTIYIRFSQQYIYRINSFICSYIGIYHTVKRPLFCTYSVYGSIINFYRSRKIDSFLFFFVYVYRYIQHFLGKFISKRKNFHITLQAYN